VKKVPLGGGTPSIIAIQPDLSGEATGLAVDDAFVYWSINPGGGSGFIYQAPLTGGTPAFLAFANQPSDIAVDDSFVYWAENNSGPDMLQGVRKVPLGGGDMITVTTFGYPFELNLAENDVYFSYSDPMNLSSYIGRIDKAGGVVFPVASAIERPSALVVDGTNIYWAEFSPGIIKKMSLIDGTVTTLASGLNQPHRIALDDTHIYFAEWANATPKAGSVKKVLLSGGEATILANGLNGPSDVAVDSTHIYWSEFGTDGTDGTKKSSQNNPRSYHAQDFQLFPTCSGTTHPQTATASLTVRALSF
jgi:hypothetical protein